MNEETFRLISAALIATTIIVQLVGIGVMLWKGGVYVGKVNQLIIQLFEKQAALDMCIAQHIKDDIAGFKELVTSQSVLTLNLSKLVSEMERLKGQELRD